MNLVLVFILILLITYYFFKTSKFSTNFDPRLLIWKNGVSIQTNELDISQSPLIVNSVFPTSYTLSIDCYLKNNPTDQVFLTNQPIIKILPSGQIQNTSFIVPIGTWFNVVQVVTPGSLNMYVNGILISSLIVNNVNSATNNQLPGTVRVKNVYYWSSALNQSDIIILGNFSIQTPIISVIPSGIICKTGILSATSPSFTQSDVVFNSVNKEYIDFGSQLWNIGTIGFSIQVSITFTKLTRWMRIFDGSTGINGAGTLFLGYNGTGIRFVYTVGATQVVTDLAYLFSLNVNYNILTIYNPNISTGNRNGQVQIWINGQLLITKNNLSAKAVDITLTANYVGRSSYTTDPYLDAKIKILNIFNYPINDTITPDNTSLTFARYIKIERPGPIECMNLTQIMVYSTTDGANIALNKTVTASSLANGGTLAALTNGQTVWGSNGIFHTNCTEAPWAIIDLLVPCVISNIMVYNRQDACSSRAVGCILTLLDSNKGVVYTSNPLPDVNGGKSLIAGCAGPTGWNKYSVNIPSPVVTGIP